MDKEALKNDQGYLIEVSKGVEELRKGNKENVAKSQQEAFKQLNRTISEINKFFFTTASLLIPIIFSLVSVETVRKTLDKSDAINIKYSLALLLTSLILGLVHMLAETLYLRKWLKTEDRKLKLWSQSFWPKPPLPENVKDSIVEYNSTRNKVSKISQEIEKESTYLFLVLQAIFLILGVVPLFFILARQLP